MDEIYTRVRRLFTESRDEVERLLVELFGHEAEVSRVVAGRLLDRASIDDLLAVGLIAETDQSVTALARVARFRGVVIASDRHGFRRRRDFAAGPAPATASLARAVRPIERGRVLDLGCGTGTQALWLARGGAEAIGLDINHRALAFAEFNRRLNSCLTAKFEEGDFLTAPADVALDERFDVVVANPPFVLAPSTELAYRDRPLPGDDVGRVTLERIARALAPGGRGYLLCNWIGNDSWEAKPTGWLASVGMAGAVARVASVGIEAYARNWNRDLPEAERLAAVEHWVRALEADGVERIHIGVIAVGRPPSGRGRTRNARCVAVPSPAWKDIEEGLAA